MKRWRLGFREYGDFADYYGPQWNYRLRSGIAWIPLPFRFLKGAFESGFAVTILTDFAERPELYLDEAGQKKLEDVARGLWRKLDESLLGDPQRESKYGVLPLGDNFGDEPATVDDFQDELFNDPNLPF